MLTFLYFFGACAAYAVVAGITYEIFEIFGGEFGGPITAMFWFATLPVGLGILLVRAVHALLRVRGD